MSHHEPTDDVVRSSAQQREHRVRVLGGLGLAERNPVDVDDRVVSRDYVGNYLEARYGPDEVRVFIDDRVDMYPIDVVLDYHELTLDDGDFAEVLEGNRATAVLWDRDSTLGRWLRDSPAWEIVHQDDDWLVAVPEVAP